MTSLIRAGALLIVLAVTQGALAQASRDDAAGASRREEARRAFLEGADAAAAERWADSEQAFRRAFELSHTYSALFNRAVALRALGRHVEARRDFERLLSEFQGLPDGLRVNAERLRSESAGRVGLLELADLTLSPLVISVDGVQLRDTQQRPLQVELDEGAHELRVVSPGHEPFVWSGSVIGGSRQTVRVLLRAEPASAPIATPAATPPAEAKGRLWWWIGGAAALVAVGVGTTFAVRGLTQEGDQVSPQTANVHEVP